MAKAQSTAFNKAVFTQVINLKRSPERLVNITEQLSKASLSFNRLEATDGRALNLETDPDTTYWIDQGLWQKRHHRNPIATEIGCYLSHIKAIETFRSQDKAFGLILEDDARVSEDLIPALLPALRPDQDWDILKLHARHPGPLITRQTYAMGRRLCSFITKPAGATAYILTRAAAAKIYEHARPASRPFDWMFDEGHKMGLKVRIIMPMPVGLQRTPSTIESDRKRSPEDWLSKHTDRPLTPRWALPFRRLGDDLHRIGYNLFADGGLAALFDERLSRE